MTRNHLIKVLDQEDVLGLPNPSSRNQDQAQTLLILPLNQEEDSALLIRIQEALTINDLLLIGMSIYISCLTTKNQI